MSYVSGFLLVVSNDKNDAYCRMAEYTWTLFKDYGCLATHENWGVDVKDEKVASCPMAVKKEQGETVVFSLMERPDKETCDKGWATMMKHPRMEKKGDMPFDGMRTMWGGFEPLFDARASDGSV